MRGIFELAQSRCCLAEKALVHDEGSLVEHRARIKDCLSEKALVHDEGNGGLVEHRARIKDTIAGLAVAEFERTQAVFGKAVGKDSLCV